MANGTINSCRFVMIDTSADFKCLQATANADVIGVSMEGSNYPPLSDLVTSPVAATAGQYVRIFGDGEMCLVEAGAAVVRGAKLKADSVGRGVPIDSNTTLQNIGAVAMQSASGAGEKIVCQVIAQRSERGAIA
jgi:hypothetical protein